MEGNGTFILDNPYHDYWRPTDASGQYINNNNIVQGLYIMYRFRFQKGYNVLKVWYQRFLPLGSTLYLGDIGTPCICIMLLETDVWLLLNTYVH